MARRPGVFKKPSYYFGDNPDFHKISKAAWADLYFDLYAQYSGKCDDVTPEEVMYDVLHRLAILKTSGIR